MAYLCFSMPCQIVIEDMASLILGDAFWKHRLTVPMNQEPLPNCLTREAPMISSRPPPITIFWVAAVVMTFLTLLPSPAQALECLEGFEPTSGISCVQDTPGSIWVMIDANNPNTDIQLIQKQTSESWAITDTVKGFWNTLEFKPIITTNGVAFGPRSLRPRYPAGASAVPKAAAVNGVILTSPEEWDFRQGYLIINRTDEKTFLDMKGAYVPDRFAPNQCTGWYEGARRDIPSRELVEERGLTVIGIQETLVWNGKIQSSTCADITEERDWWTVYGVDLDTNRLFIVVSKAESTSDRAIAELMISWGVDRAGIVDSGGSTGYIRSDDDVEEMNRAEARNIANAIAVFERPMPDADPRSYYIGALVRSIERGDTEGTAEGLFEGDRATLQSELAKWVCLARNTVPKPQSTASVPAGTAPGDWHFQYYAGFIEEGSLGILKDDECPSGVCPNLKVTRAYTFKVLTRAFLGVLLEHEDNRNCEEWGGFGTAKSLLTNTLSIDWSDDDDTLKDAFNILCHAGVASGKTAFLDGVTPVFIPALDDLLVRQDLIVLFDRIEKLSGGAP